MLYRIREYYSVYDEYLVEAPDEATAEESVECFKSQRIPVTDVEQVEFNTADDYLNTMRFEITEDGEELLLN